MSDRDGSGGALATEDEAVTDVTVLLRGVVGSTAYGLNRAGSDVDRAGIFAARTLDVAGLGWSPQRESRVTTKPDVTLHEAGKACRLMLGCNPTAMELLWLDGYEVSTAEGRDLVGIRDAFLWSRGVTNAYGGYARQQAVKLAARGDTFSSDTWGRTAKHARHLLRLLRQGAELHRTGALTLRVEDPAEYFAFDDLTPLQMLYVYEREDSLFGEAAAASVLPAQPDRGRVGEWLRATRRRYLA